MAVIQGAWATLLKPDISLLRVASFHHLEFGVYVCEFSDGLPIWLPSWDWEIYEMMSINPFAGVSRCRAVLYDTTDLLVYKCELAAGHKERHKTHTKERKLIQFTDEEARRALQYVVDAEKVKILDKFIAKKSTKPLLGWRAWQVDLDSNKQVGLRAISAPATHGFWETVTRARGTPYLKSVGMNSGEDHGIHCYKMPDTMIDALGSEYPVYGSIELSGMVVEHLLGYRAQIATVKELWINHPNPRRAGELINILEARYQCPVHVFNASQRAPRAVKAWASWMVHEISTGRYK